MESHNVKLYFDNTLSRVILTSLSSIYINESKNGYHGYVFNISRTTVKQPVLTL